MNIGLEASILSSFRDSSHKRIVMLHIGTELVNALSIWAENRVFITIKEAIHCI